MRSSGFVHLDLQLGDLGLKRVLSRLDFLRRLDGHRRLQGDRLHEPSRVLVELACLRAHYLHRAYQPVFD